MMKFIAVAFFLAVAAAAPAPGYLAAPLTYGVPYAASPLTYGSPATLTTYDSVSSPLTYTAKHQAAVAYTSPLTYNEYQYRYNAPASYAYL